MIRRVAKCGVAVVIALWLFAGTSAAASLTLYVSPGGSDTAACTQTDPCSFDHGVASAPTRATVSVAAGTYTSAGGLTPADGVAIDGPDGGTATVNFAGAGPALQLGSLALSSVNKLSNLALVCQTCTGAVVLGEGEELIDRLDVVGPAGAGGALSIVGVNDALSTITNSLVVGGVYTGASLNPNVVTFTNDTLVGGTYGLVVHGAGTVALDNSIAYVSSGSAAVRLQSLGAGTVTFESDSSDYGAPTVDTSGGGTVVDTNQANEQKTPPTFVPDGGYEESAGSATRDSGNVTLVSGLLDLAGQPRELDGNVDIGAYEYVPTPVLGIGPVSALTTTSVTLNGTVATANATGSAVFNYGLHSSYGQSTTAVTLSSTSSAQAVAGAVTGLTPGTTYHYELCATLVVPTCSADETFSTTTVTLPVGPPQLTGVSFLHSAFRAKAGTKLRLTLSQPARISVAFVQTIRGRKHRGRCVSSAKHGKRCTITKRRGTRSFAGIAGANTFAFSAAGLPAGRYTATITAANAAGLPSNAVTLTFAVKATPRHKKRKR